MSKVSIATVMKHLKKLPPEVLTGFNDTLNKAVETYGEVQKERTAQVKITATRDVALADIESKRAILEKYLDLAFNERAEVLRGYFDAFDQAMEASNTQLAVAVLSSVVETIKTSPLSAGVEIRQLMLSKEPLLLE
jgi:hypothetical protein